MLKGKNAIVTGSTSGIGLGVAQALAAEGCNILFNGFGDKAAIDATVKGTREAYGVRTEYSPADMSKPLDIEAMVRQCETALGSADILVNNAGIQHTAPVEDFPAEKWDAILAINLSSAFHAIKAAMPGMKKRNFGRIINIASAHGLVASRQKAAYVAAKHGLVGLTKVLAIEGQSRSVRVHLVSPGGVMTDLSSELRASRGADPGEWMSADEVAEAIVFCAMQSGVAVSDEIVLRRFKSEPWR